MSKKIQVYQYEKERRTIGLEDGGHHILKCSNCDAPLIDIWSTNPKIDLQFNIQAECGHCGDKSFIIQVNGPFHYGPAYVDKQGKYEENGELYSAIEDHITNDEKEIVIFRTRKLRKWK